MSKIDNVCILSINIEYLNTTFNELDIFVQELRENNLEFIEICIQETWLDENDDFPVWDGKVTIISHYANLVVPKVVLSYNEKFDYTSNKSTIWKGQFVDEHAIYGDFFDALTNNSLYTKITLPTRFSNTRCTLIDIFFCNLNNTTVNTTAGIIM